MRDLQFYSAPPQLLPSLGAPKKPRRGGQKLSKADLLKRLQEAGTNLGGEGGGEGHDDEPESDDSHE